MVPIVSAPFLAVCSEQTTFLSAEWMPHMIAEVLGGRHVKKNSLNKFCQSLQSSAGLSSYSQMTTLLSFHSVCVSMHDKHFNKRAIPFNINIKELVIQVIGNMQTS